jgi:uncharacterized protein DUF1573
MKTYFLSLTIVFFIVACNRGQENIQKSDLHLGTSEKYAEIVFDQDSCDFGNVTEGEKVGWYFYFTNKGQTDLLIINAHATCGCTIPEYDIEPVAPGERGFVKVIFDSSGRSGKQYKTVTIESNAKNNIVKLALTAEIIK